MRKLWEVSGFKKRVSILMGLGSSLRKHENWHDCLTVRSHAVCEKHSNTSTRIPATLTTKIQKSLFQRIAMEEAIGILVVTCWMIWLELVFINNTQKKSQKLLERAVQLLDNLYRGL